MGKPAITTGKRPPAERQRRVRPAPAGASKRWTAKDETAFREAADKIAKIASEKGTPFFPFGPPIADE